MCMNANIMNKQIFHSIQYDLKDQRRSQTVTFMFNFNHYLHSYGQLFVLVLDSFYMTEIWFSFG